MADINNRTEMLAAISTPGTYTMAAGVNYGVLSGVANGVTLRAETISSDVASKPIFDRVILNGSNNVTLNSVYINYQFNGEAVSYPTLELVNCDDFTLDNSLVEGDVDGSGYYTGYAVRTYTSDRQLFQNSEFRHFAKCLRPEGNGVQIINNNIGPFNSDGIGTSAVTSLVIRNNYIHDRLLAAPGGHGDMIQFQLDVGTAMVEDNFLDTNVGDPIQGIHAATVTTKTNVTIQNNVCCLGLANAISGGNYTNILVDNHVIHRTPNTLGAGGSDDTSGAYIPKINISGTGSVTNSAANQVLFNSVSQDGINGNTWNSGGDHIAARAAARVDPRWAHFFSATPSRKPFMMPGGKPLAVSGKLLYVG